MSIRQFRPMTAATRYRSVSGFDEITRDTPEKALLEPIKKSGGRNNLGHLTSRHRGGWHKRMYRKIDFKREKFDLADVKAVMGIPGGALMAIGKADSKSRYPAQEAAEMAIANPLLDIDVKGAQGVLFNFSGGPDLTLGEVNDAANLIAREVDPSALMFFGMSSPCEEMSNEGKLTLLATGIDPPLPSNWLSEIKEDVRTFFSGKKSSAW